MTIKYRRPIDEKRSCLACGNNLNHRRPNVIFCDVTCQNTEWRWSNPEKHRAASYNWYHNNKAKKQLNINNNQDQTNRKTSSGSSGSTSGATGGRLGDIKASKAQQENMTVRKALKGQVQYQKSKLKVARDEV